MIMTLMHHRGPCQLTHVKQLDWNEKTSLWTCNPTTFGRCGVQNMCGQDIKKYVVKLKGNLATGSFFKRGGPIDQI